MAESNRGIGSLFCNDEGDQFENEYVFEKSGDEQEDYQEESIDYEQAPILDETQTKPEPLKNNRSTRISDSEAEKLERIKKALDLNDSEALRWCLKTIWEIHGEEIDMIAKEVERVERKMKKIRTL